MKIESERNIVAGLGFLFLGSLVAVALIDASRHHYTTGIVPPVIPAASRSCVECHSKVTPQTVVQWNESLHGQKGVSCMNCHAAQENSSSGFAHHGARVTMAVSPLVCASCHKGEAEQMARSPHGAPKLGREIKFIEGKPDAKSWPSPAVGRIYPDGGAGSCTICHSRHGFQSASAKNPALCISCHLADGSAEAWRQSPHGAFAAFPPASTAAVAAPLCVTCHMSATGKGNAMTHDVSSRLTWQAAKDGKISRRENSDARRDKMFDACLQCHGNTFVENSFAEIDALFKIGGALPASWPHLSELLRAKH